MASFQAKDDGGLIQVGAMEMREVVSVRYILKKKTNRFPEALDVGLERRGIKNGPKVWA